MKLPSFVDCLLRPTFALARLVTDDVRVLIRPDMADPNIAGRHGVIRQTSTLLMALRDACREDSTAVVLTIPADHAVQCVETWRKAIEVACREAAACRTPVLLGSSAKRINGDLGYIACTHKPRRGQATVVRGFCSHPDRRTRHVLRSERHVFVHTGVAAMPSDWMLWDEDGYYGGDSVDNVLAGRDLLCVEAAANWCDYGTRWGWMRMWYHTWPYGLQQHHQTQRVECNDRI